MKNRCIIFLGMAGSGKGTQSARLSEHFLYQSLSTGDLLRQAINDNGQSNVEIKHIIESGQLVPDPIVLQLVADSMIESSNDKFILDGFPRNIAQAKLLSELIQKMNVELDHVILFDLSLDASIKRISGRRICSKCSEIYHVDYKVPKHKNQCDRCGSSLIQRKDDSEDTVKKRYEVYLKNTLPLQEFYHSKLKKINANLDPEAVYQQIVEIVQ